MAYPEFTFDAEADAAYVAFREVGRGAAARNVPVQDAAGQVGVVLDYSADGELLGVEILGAARSLDPALLDRYRG
ncbi:DUF2283 domain-containing protein [Saccharopolyspora cebuensis]|uniref:DUF2283 domain-containing protein n=1 Tax=Saccharopolyspora cebuensis TaxID=418759 RepID=A0ABV4CKK6_9PSEU